MNYLDEIIQENKFSREYEVLLVRRKELISDSFVFCIKYGKDYVDKLEEFNKAYLANINKNYTDVDNPY
jgi:hypothetical protein